jgi:hypothetical protein
MLCKDLRHWFLSHELWHASMLEDFYKICMPNYDFSSTAPIANQDLDNQWYDITYQVNHGLASIHDVCWGCLPRQGYLLCLDSL